MNLPGNMTLEQTLADQLQLASLCADRELVTGELFAANAYYGLDLILKQYAGFEASYALRAVVPHGPYLSQDALWDAERQARVPAVMSYPAYRAAIYARRTAKLVIPSAAPYLYLQRLLDDQPRPERHGTIFFPYHSTHHVTVQGDFASLAKRLRWLPDEFQPVTVCMYWKDVCLGHHRPYEEAGLRIVSAGHIFDPLFLARFHHLCSTHRYSASNHVGSHLFYSVTSGCSYFQLEDQAFGFDADAETMVRDLWTDAPDMEQSLARMFADPRHPLTPDQLATVRRFLGAESLLSPEELRRQLLECERRDRTGFLVRNTQSRPRLVLPAYYQRGLGQVVRRLRG